MPFRLISIAVAWLASTILPPAVNTVTAAAQAPLNVVFILVDDLGWRDLGCFGSDFYETPSLDALAASGMRFSSAYAACPVCSPTRASIQTGKYPARLKTTDYFGGPQPKDAVKHPRFQNRALLPPNYLDQLPLEENTIAEALRDAGYATFFAGKWHLGPRDFWPEDQGYDINKGGYSSGMPLNYFPPYANPRLADGSPDEHLDDRLASEAVEFIKAYRAEAFFLFLSLYDVHVPLMAPAELKRKYAAKAKLVGDDRPRYQREGDSDARQVQDHAVYAAMVETMDACVGKVLRGLEEVGVAERTVVFFMSDNGGLSTAEGSPTSNVPLRAGKGWMYEGGIRVPMIVRWPGVTQPGAVGGDYVISTDFYPTILEMAGLMPRPEQHKDGVSFVPLLQGSANFHRGPIFWHYPHYGNQGGTPAAAIRDGDWKLIEFFEDGRVELFNLADDVGEQRNLATTEVARASAMQRQLHQWQLDVKAAMPTPNRRVNPAAQD